jgi:hypothetical protein
MAQVVDGVDVQPQRRGLGQVEHAVAGSDVLFPRVEAEGRLRAVPAGQEQRGRAAAGPVADHRRGVAGGGERGVEIRGGERWQVGGQRDHGRTGAVVLRRRDARGDGGVELPWIADDVQAGVLERGPLHRGHVRGDEDDGAHGLRRADRGQGVEEERLGEGGARDELEAGLGGAAAPVDDDGGPGAAHDATRPAAAASPAAWPSA